MIFNMKCLVFTELFGDFYLFYLFFFTKKCNLIYFYEESRNVWLVILLKFLYIFMLFKLYF